MEAQAGIPTVGLPPLPGRASLTFQLLLYAPQLLQDAADLLDGQRLQVSNRAGVGGCGGVCETLGVGGPWGCGGPHLVGCLQDRHLILCVDPGFQVLPCTARVLEEDPARDKDKGSNERWPSWTRTRVVTKGGPALWNLPTPWESSCRPGPRVGTEARAGAGPGLLASSPPLSWALRVGWLGQGLGRRSGSAPQLWGHLLGAAHDGNTLETHGATSPCLV